MATKPKPGSSMLTSWKLIGIVSFGPSFCGIEGLPGVYTRVRHYIDWILENVEA